MTVSSQKLLQLLDRALNGRLYGVERAIVLADAITEAKRLTDWWAYAMKLQALIGELRKRLKESHAYLALAEKRAACVCDVCTTPDDSPLPLPADETPAVLQPPQPTLYMPCERHKQRSYTVTMKVGGAPPYKVLCPVCESERPADKT